MASAIDGLVSGLNTTQIIADLMKLEARPQTLMKSTVITAQSRLADMRGLNAAIAALTDLSKETGKPGAIDFFATTSSSSSVSSVASAGASAGSITFRVDQTAQAQVIVSGAMGEWPMSPAVFTIVGSDGAATEITAASGSLADVAKAITAANVGVNAVSVPSGPDPVTGLPSFRMQLTAEKTGSVGAFQVFAGTKDEHAAGTATSFLTMPGSTTIAAARDASVTLWAGSSAAQTIVSSSNTFTGLLPGVDVTVSRVETEPVTVTVTQDNAKSAAKTAELFGGLAKIFGMIADKSTVSTTIDASGKSVTKAGTFTGDSTVRLAKESLFAAISTPIDGRSPAAIGVKITQDGTVEFDKEVFAAAMEKDPIGTKKVMDTLTTRLTEAGTKLSDKYDGQVTARVTGQEKVIEDLNSEITNWDRRLEQRRSALERTYSSLEVRLSKYQSQANWLTSQLAGLSTGS